VLAAGAWSPALVDLQDQCVSKVCCRNSIVRRSHLTFTRHGYTLTSNCPRARRRNTKMSL
jgi:hypothetical protein